MIERQDTDGIAVVRIACGKVNLLDLEAVGAIAETFAEIGSDSSRAAVLTGAGRTFSAGVDLKRFLDGGPEYVERFVPALSAAFLALFTVPKPVVAAVNGHAIGGGCILACGCDRRLVAAGPGTIGVPEMLVGLPIPAAGMEILRFAMGARLGRAAITGAGTYPAAEVVERGYADELVDPAALMDRALATADQLASKVPADTYAYTKARLRQRVLDRLPADGAPDAETIRLWALRSTDGWVRDYLDRTVGAANRDAASRHD